MSELLAIVFDPEVFLATNPPLFYMMAWLVGHLGIAEPWLRTVPLLSGLALVVLTRQLALELGLSRRQAMVAAALVTCSPLAIEYATDFSHYAPVAALATLGFVLLIRAMRSGRTGPWHAYFTCMVVGFYTHYIFLVLGLAHTMWVAWFCWVNRDKGGQRCLVDFVRRGLIASVFVLPWLPIFLFSVELGGLLKETTRHYYVQAPALLPWVTEMARALAGLQPRVALLGVIPTALWVGGIWLHKHLVTRTTLLLILPPSMLLVHVVSMYHTMTSFLEGGAYFPFRYGLPLLPLLAVPTALALCAIGRELTRRHTSRLRRSVMAMAAFACALWLGSMAVQSMQLVTEPQRPDLEATATLLQQELRHGDAVMVVPTFSQAQALAWYLTGDIQAEVVGTQWGVLPGSEGGPSDEWFYGPLADISFHPAQMELTPERFGRVFVISVEEGHAQRAKFDHGRILHHLQDSIELDWELQSERLLPGVRILVLEPRGGMPQSSFVQLLADQIMGGG